VNAAYKERWEARNDPRTGAGVAREANVLKALFNDNQEYFLRKIKLVLLPGATTDDIPIELRAVVQRFKVTTVDGHGLEDLLRTLTGRPEFVAPPLGKLPLLPPKPVDSADNVSPRPTKAVVDAVAELPDRERLIVSLTYFEQLTRDDIAEILDVDPNEVSRLVQSATSRLGDSLTTDLAKSYNQPVAVSAQDHSARIALLSGGPRSGQRVAIEQGQTTLTIPERFEYDKGYAEVIDHYGYVSDTAIEVGAVLFNFLHQEHHVVTES
jgi:hypothetical protein